MNSYELSREWFDWCFDNPNKINPNHSAIYFFAIEHCNRLGWKKKFGFPSQMVMEAVGIKNWRTYSKALNELVDFGFIQMIETSKNQYSSNIIAIVKNTEATTKATTKALDKALQKHHTKQGKSTVSIDKQNNNKPITIDNILLSELKISDDNNFLEFGNDKFEINQKELINFKTAVWFQKLFIKNLKEKNSPTTVVEKAKYKNYVAPIRLMFDSDCVTQEQFKQAYDFLNSFQGEFWKSNVLSTSSLRKNIQKLIIQKNSDNGKPQFISTPKRQARFTIAGAEKTLRADAERKQREMEDYINSKEGTDT